MSNIYVAGVAMTVFGRHPERSLEDLAREALQWALKDVGCAVSDLGTAFYSGMTNGMLQGQFAIPGQVVFSKIGIEGIPVFNVENACASGSSAFHLACQSVRAGSCDVALALGAEKMNIPDKARAMAIFEAGWDVSRVEENFRILSRLGEGVEPPPGSESDRPYSRFMAIYAALCRYHMKTWGTTQRQIAAVSAEISASAIKMQEHIGEAAAVAEQSSASTEEVSASTRETSASTEQIAASAQTLSSNAETLNALVASFTLKS